MINSLKGTVSDETLLGLLPFIPDVQAELEKVKEQKEANMDLFGGGNLFGSDTEEETDEETNVDE
jgi:hypothetical protein